MLRYGSFILLFCFSTISLFAQFENSLLWEIKGNSLLAPSYLFGSIHIMDERVFDLPDSVLPKMKQCEAVYCELNLDSAVKEMVKRELRKAKRKVSDILTQREIERLDQKFKKENIDFKEDIRDASPYDVYSTYEYKKFMKHDKATFLDAYLFGIGKKYGKELGGLESVEEQFSAMNELSDDTQRELLIAISDSAYNQEELFEKMVQDYLRQDLNKLDEDFSADISSEGYKDILLTQRNYKMAHRMDSIMQRKSMFVIVGAAHLAGDEGLINLLRKNGYDVTPVISGRNGLYTSFLPADNEIPWIDVTDEVNGFKVQMPGTPTDISMYGLAAKIHYDYVSGMVFLAAGIPVGADEQSGSFEQVLKGLESRANLKDKTKITYHDATGYSYTMELPQGHYILRVINSGSTGYMLMVGAQNNTPDKDVTDRFFNSLSFFEGVKLPNIVFVDDTAGFKMYVPASFKLSDIDNSKDYKQHSYEGFDYNTRFGYYVNYADYNPGVYFDDVKDLFDKAVSPLTSVLGHDPEINIDTVYQSYPCRYVEANYTDGSYFMGRYILRDNRFYDFVVSGRNLEDISKVRGTLDSFAFIPLMAPHYTTYMPIDSSFLVLMPSSPEVKIDSTIYGVNYSRSTQYGASDKNSGNSFFIMEKELSKYMYARNDSDLMMQLKTPYLHYNDSVLFEKLDTGAGAYTYTLLLRPADNLHLRKNLKFCLNGRKVYVLSFNANPGSRSDSMKNTFFTSFKIRKPDHSFDVFTNKLNVALDDLHSTDSATHISAYNYFTNNTTVIKNDIPLLEATLRESFPDDSSLGMNSRYQVYKALLNTIDSNQMISYIKSHYDSIPVMGVSRLVALGALSDVHSEESMHLLKNYFLNARPTTEKGYWIWQAFHGIMYDTVKTSAILYPEVLNLVNDSVYGDVICNLTSHLLQSGIINPKLCEPYHQVFLDRSTSEYRKEIESRNSDDYYYSSFLYSSVNILTRLKPDEQTIQLMHRLVTDTDFYDKSAPIAYLASQGQKVDKKIIKGYLNEDKGKRISLYKELQKVNETDIYPKELKNQKFFAEADLLNSVYDDDYPEAVEFLEQRNVMYKGTMQRFYLYKISWYGDSFYFALAGPYPDDDNFYFEGALTGYGDKLDSLSIDEHFNKSLSKDE